MSAVEPKFAQDLRLTFELALQAAQTESEIASVKRAAKRLQDMAKFMRVQEARIECAKYDTRELQRQISELCES